MFNAEYITVWDGGETTIISPCRLVQSGQKLKITKMGDRNIVSENPNITYYNVDDAVEILEKEYVTFHNKEYVISDDDETVVERYDLSGVQQIAE